MKLSVMLEQLSSGMLRSMEIFFLTLIFSLPLGLLISFGLSLIHILFEPDRYFLLR